MLIGIVVSIGFSSCSINNHLQAINPLYTGAELNINKGSNPTIPSVIDTKLKEAILPKPNKKTLGTQLPLYFYYHTRDPKKKKKKGWHYFWKYKVGQAPVLMSSVHPDHVSRLMENRLSTNGYFHSTVTYKINVKDSLRASIVYTANVAPAYYLDALEYPTDTTQRLQKIVGAAASKSFIRTGDRYNLDIIKKERERIDSILKTEGYFYFNPDFLLFQADTNIGNHQINLWLRLKNGLPKEATNMYRVNDIYLFPEYNLHLNDTLSGDTVRVDSIYFISAYHEFKPKIIANQVYFSKNKIYSAKDYDLTLRRLIGLGTFKYGNIKLEPSSIGSDSLLDARIYLTPFAKGSIRTEVEGVTKSSGFTGPGLSVTFRNRNLFHGAEQFSLKFDGNYEVSLRGGQQSSAFQFSVSPQLQFPRFLVPFPTKQGSSVFVPRTNIGANYTIAVRTGLFTLNSYSANFGYVWKETLTKQHELNPIAITYVRPSNETDSFKALIKLYPSLLQQFEQQYILGSNYTYTFTNQVYPWIRNPVFFQGRIDLSGNIIYGLQSVTSAKKDTSNAYEIFNNPYSQFTKVQLDFRYYYRLGKVTKLVSRLFVGVGLPYGNSNVMPYYQSFSSGGASSLRGFQFASVGPGASIPIQLQTVNIFNQVADMKLEANLEYRFPIISYLKGALFMDAGNVWNIRPGSLGEDAVFKLNNFFNQLAVDAGAGLRLDITYFVIRVDVGYPLRYPFLNCGQHWVFHPYDSSDPTCVKPKPIVFFAVGYPF